MRIIFLILGFSVFAFGAFAQQDIDTLDRVTSTTITKDGEITTESRDARAPASVIVDLALGYCARNVHDSAYGIVGIPTPYEIDSQEWREMASLDTTNDLNLFNPRAHADLDIIVDMHPNGQSCWMQAAGREAGAAADEIAAAIERDGSLTIAQQGTSGKGVFSTLYQGKPEIGKPLPILMLHRYGTTETKMISLVIGLAEVTASPIQTQ